MLTEGKHLYVALCNTMPSDEMFHSVQHDSAGQAYQRFTIARID